MLKISICDDNEASLQELCAELAIMFEKRPEDYRVENYHSGEELLRSSGCDVLFLDVEMEGLDGIETARRLRARGDRCKLIFLTAHEKYAFSAFEVEATGYLMKPVNPQKLRYLLGKIEQEMERQAPHFLSVKQGAQLIRVESSDILYVEVMDRKLFIHTKGAVYDFYEKLDRLEKSLPSSFFRCHRSYIVNLSHVRRYDKTTITLSSGEVALLSKRKYGEFCQMFLHFLKKGGGEL